MDAPLLVIAAGGTGGHMFPAQALSQEMLRRGWRVALSTDDRGLRYAGGFPDAVTRREVKAATFSRGGVVGKLTAPFAILSGVADTLSWFKSAKPAAVAGFGGYPSAPALTAAWRLGLPRLIHEQNGVLGRVNAWFATRVNALACGISPVANAPAGAPLLDVGNPIRDAARRVAGAPYAPPAPDEPFRLLVFGGSQGASAFASLVPSAIAATPDALRSRLRVTQQVRQEELDGVAEAYAEAGVEAELAAFFSDLPERIAAAHLVFSRAGASTIAELTAIGRPSVLAPFPHAAADHQTANARMLSSAGAAVLTPQAETTPESLAETLSGLADAPERLSAMAAASLSLGRPRAAEDLADLVERVAARPSG